MHDDDNGQDVRSAHALNLYFYHYLYCIGILPSANKQTWTLLPDI